MSTLCFLVLIYPVLYRHSPDLFLPPQVEAAQITSRFLSAPAKVLCANTTARHGITKTLLIPPVGKYPNVLLIATVQQTY